MSELQRPGYTKHPAPPLLKLILLIAVIFGFYLRNYSQKSKDKYINFSNIIYKKIDLGSIYVSFDMMNNSNRIGIEKVLIEVYDKNDTKIASKITDVHLKKFTKERYTKQVDKFSRPIKSDESLRIVVKIFKPSILK